MTRTRRVLETLHRGVNLLLLVGIAAQFYAAGLAVWGVGYGFHAVLGWVLLGFAPLLLILALASHRLGPHAAFALLVTIGLVLQPVLVFVVAPWSRALGALHPLNALLVFSLLLATERRLRRT